METHFYRTHLRPDDAPFWCGLCYYSSKTFNELKRHVLAFLPHEKKKVEAMRQGTFTADENYLQRNQHRYKFGPLDYVALFREESAAYWESRRKL
jgi:hypothetical protein